MGLVSEAAITRAQFHRDKVVQTLRHSSPTALERMRELVGSNYKIRSEERQRDGPPLFKKFRNRENPRGPPVLPQGPRPPPRLEKPDTDTIPWKAEQWTHDDWGTDGTHPYTLIISRFKAER